MNSVMIIDDSEADQFLARCIIEKSKPDIEILQAYDGQEALEILGTLTQQPDVIFLDINMPRMNGHEFLAQYDKWEEQSMIVIMLTSSSQEQDKERSMAYKCVKDYYTKPLDFSRLETALEAAEASGS